LDIKKEAKIWDILKNIGVDEKSDLKREEQEKEIRENNQKLNN
jgi:triacylglycerol esterase/lipase EstA (alpha/beta hydrolase family)|tara:strand:- start:487 stop:615 length:129 start_codon:yes stop_codon:yes gene_type:complete